MNIVPNNAFGSFGSSQMWHTVSAEVIQCDLCPRSCQLREGQRGFCFVRQRLKNAVVLASYGRSSGFCIDPIEKKPLYHFFPGSSVLSFGTSGCNLGCQFCQNWDISKSRESDTLASAASPEAIANAARSAGCASIAFTYNDPVIFMEYAIDTAKAAHDFGVKAVAVTAGYINEAPRREFFRYMDAANVDLKGFTEDFYNRICLGHLDPVLETLIYIRKETSVWLEITNLIIPGLNDSDKELNEMTTWISKNLGPDVPLHFTAFHPDFKIMDRPPTPKSSLLKARQIGFKNGLRHVYVGNVRDKEGSSTKCAHCGKILISRQDYDITGWHLDRYGRCEFCQQPLPGVFGSEPGTWGSKRQTIEI